MRSASATAPGAVTAHEGAVGVFEQLTHALSCRNRLQLGLTAHVDSQNNAGELGVVGMALPADQVKPSVVSLLHRLPPARLTGYISL